MTPNLALTIGAGVLVACGVTLMLERSLTRILLGFILVGNGVNLLLIVASGPPGSAPIVGLGPDGPIADPLPQALSLTAIVITLGVTGFLLAMAYRAWQLNRHDDVQDDVEDATIRRLADLDEASTTFDDSQGDDPDEEGSDAPSPTHAAVTDPIAGPDPQTDTDPDTDTDRGAP